MSVLTRKLIRDLWQIRWRALVVVLTVASGVGIYAGIAMAIATGFHTRDVLLDRMRFADLEIQFLPEDVANLPDLARVPGFARRLVLRGTVFPGDTSRINVWSFSRRWPRPSTCSRSLVRPDRHHREPARAGPASSPQWPPMI